MDLILVIILKLIIKFNRCSLQIIKSLEIAMSRYSDFQEDNEEKDLSVLNEEQQEQNLVCVKNLLPIANPLMNKIQYHPYQPKNYYPALMSSLPPILNNHQYHIDKNNMASIDESLFTHQQLKKNVAKCLLKNHKIQTLNTQLLTLKEFYANKFLVYQKFNNASSNYFATFLLKLNSVNQKETQKLGKTAFLIRNTKTPLITQRCRTERYSACKPTVEFNSNFQSGNLFRVYQKEYNQYDLILQNDINTKGNNQWFFFSVRNVPKGANLKFNIVNMSKQYSLFEYGMKPAIFSMVKFQKRQVGWVRDGTKVTYKRSNQLQKQSSRQPYYTLSFQYKFIYEGDIVYFSYTTPYTFSNLTNFMSNQLADRSHSKKVKVRSLGQTLGGNEVTFFEFTNSESRITKKSIWVLGRQHSGEVTSSFMVEGMIQFLLSDQPEAQYLMNHFVIKVVPMVNIDGVVHGNTRAELSGCDSNRKWLDPHKIYQPIIYNIKKLIQKDNIQMILDLHSHSRKLGTFFYTNSSLHDANNIKVLPMMVCKNDQRFDYRSNRFKGGNDQTARKVFYDILKKPYIYTIQSSFYGYQKEGDFRITQYQPNDYREMGITVLKTFVELSKKKLTNIRDLRTLICDKAQLEEEDNLWDRMNEADQIQSVGSDQNPSEDQFSKKQFEIIIEKPAKKVTKKKRKFSVKASQNKDQSKKPEIQLKPKQNDKDSYYKKYFSGRFSMNQKPTDRIFQLTDKPKIQSKAFSCQVDLPQRQILHKSSMNNVQTDRTKLREKIIENRELCVFGQKVEDQLTISGNTVGTQTQNQRNLFKNRNEVSIENQKMSKRIFHSNKKMTTVMLHNENNFLNKGDILHAALRMLNKR